MGWQDAPVIEAKQSPAWMSAPAVPGGDASLVSQMASKAGRLLAPIDSGGTVGKNLQNAFVPKGGVIENIKMALNPLAGRFGLSRFLQQEGQRVSDVAQISRENLPPGSPLGKVYDATKFVGRMAGMENLTPEEAQKAIATNAAGEAVGSGIARVGKKVIKGIGSKIGSAFSGIKPASYGRLLDDPAAILPEALGGPQGLSKAGKAIGKSLEEAGAVKSISPTASHGAIVDSMFKKIADSVPAETLTEENIPKLVGVLSPTEKVEMLKSLRQVMKTAADGRDPAILRMRMLWKNSLVDAIEKEAPGYAKNVATYARAALRDEFSSILPRNKYGTPSIMRVLAGGGPIGAAVGSGAGPVAGALAGAASVSPIVHGAITATTGAGLKTLPYITPIGFREIIRRARKSEKK